MTKRQQVLQRWLNQNKGEFNTTLQLTTTATRELAASGDELDWLARRWSKPVGPVVPETTPTAGAAQPAPQQTAAPADTSGTGPGPQNPPNEREEPMPDSTSLEPINEVTMFDLDNRRAQAYAATGWWPDAKSLAQALVKIEAGRSLDLPAIVAMNEVQVIQGTPDLGAGALSTLVKRSPKYDYRVIEITNELCRIRFYEDSESLGESVFTTEDAKTAGLLNGTNWKHYPRNMLFARAISNGARWFCPDAVGPFYTREEMADVVDDEPTDADVLVEGDEVPV